MAFDKERVGMCCNIAVSLLGYTSVKDEHLKVIWSFLAGNDVFAALPTGYGKSLCYAYLPSVFDQLLSTNNSVVVVITPLTAIMKDQVASFSAKGLLTAYIAKDQTDEIIIRKVMEAQYKLVFFTPEMMLLNKQWRQIFTTDPYTRNLRAVVVDEAHTLKKWGETFRKVLLRIGEIRSLIPGGVHLMALTATATKLVREDVIRILGMRNPIVVSISPSKANIMYQVKSCESLHSGFFPLVNGLKKDRTNFPRTIIYCRRFIDCGNLYLYFRANLETEFTEPCDAPDLPQYRLVDMYHSSTDPQVKEKISELFAKSSHLRIVIATVAFGMGIDCPDVRQVIHFGPPDDTESYIQETGRAGRNGLQSTAVLLLVKGRRHHIDAGMHKYINNTSTCRRNTLFNEFEGYVPNVITPCLCCDICYTKCTCSCKNNE